MGVYDIKTPGFVGLNVDDFKDVINAPVAPYVPPVAAAPVAEQKGILNEFGSGIVRGYQQMSGGLGGAIRAIGDATGSDAVSEIGKTTAGYWEKEAAENKSTAPRIEDVQGIGDVLRYGARATGEFLPQMVAAGAAAATPLGLAGVAAHTLSQETGSIYNDQPEGQKDLGRATLAAVPAATLDFLPTAHLLKRTGILDALKGQAVKAGFQPESVVKAILKNAGVQTLEEVPTETLQTAFERFGAFKPLWDAEAKSDYLNTAASTALGMAPIGGIGGGIGATVKNAQLKQQTDTIPSQDTAPSPATSLIDDANPQAAVAQPAALGDDIPDFPAPAPESREPQGVLTRAVAPIAALRESFLTGATPPADYPHQAGPGAASLLDAVGAQAEPPKRIQPDEKQQVSEALAWARNSRRGDLMQVTNESQSSWHRRVLDAYKKSNSPPDGTTEITLVNPQNGTAEQVPVGQVMDRLSSGWTAPVVSDAAPAPEAKPDEDEQTFASVTDADRENLKTAREMADLWQRGSYTNGRSNKTELFPWLSAWGKTTPKEVATGIDNYLSGKKLGDVQKRLVAEAIRHGREEAQQDIPNFPAPPAAAQAEPQQAPVTPSLSATTADKKSNLYKMAKLFAQKEGMDLTGYDDQAIADFVASYLAYRKSHSAAPSQSGGRLSAARRKARADLVGMLKGKEVGSPGNYSSPHKDLTNAGGTDTELTAYTQQGSAFSKQPDSQVNVPSVFPPASVGSIQPSTTKSIADGTPGDLVSSSKSGKSPAGGTQGNGFIKRPIHTAGQVTSDMSTLAGDHKVLGDVVQTVPINVMDNLGTQERPAEELLHDKPMLKTLPSDAVNHDTDKPVTGPVPGEKTNVADRSSHSPSLVDESNRILGNNQRNGKGKGENNEMPEVSQESRKKSEEVSDVRAQPGEQIPGDVAGETPPAERRKDGARRKLIADMTPDELRQAILTDELTGLGNRRAYDDSPDRAFEVSADADSLKWVNDNMGHGVGDELLRAIGEAFRRETSDAYHMFHISGDEFRLKGDDRAQLINTMDRVAATLAAAKLTYTAPDGTIITKKGIGISYGIGTDADSADEQLQRDKEQRAQSGARSARGDEPPGVVRESAAGREAEGGAAGEVAKPAAAKAAQPDMTSWEQDFGLMGSYTFKPVKGAPVPEGGKLLSSAIHPVKLSITKRLADQYGIPRDYHAFRVSVIENKDGGSYSQVEYMGDNYQAADGTVDAHFVPLKNAALENRDFDRISRLAEKAWEKEQNQAEPSLFAQAENQDIDYTNRSGANTIPLEETARLLESGWRRESGGANGTSYLYDPEGGAWRYEETGRAYRPFPTKEQLELNERINNLSAKEPETPQSSAADEEKKGNVGAGLVPARPAQPAKVADSGEELTYNKRNRIRTGVKWADVADKNEALKAKEIQKPGVYPKPDYQALIDDGMQPLAAHIVKQVYDSMAVKPDVRGIPTDADYQRYIEAVNRVMAGALKWAGDPAAFKAFLGKQVTMAGGMAGRQISLTDVAAATEVKLLDMIYPGGWKAFRDEVHILGGNKLLQALQPGYDESKRALKDIGLGWPAKTEAWQRQGYQIVPTEGFEVAEVKQYGDQGSIFFVRKREGKSTYNYLDAAQFYSREEAQAYLDELKPFALFTKRRRLVDTYATEEEAKEAARAAVKKEGGTTVDERGVNVADAERTGPAYREEGEDITSDRLREVFGFRGVNFGNWVPNDERQLHLNHAYDSFMDLAGLLNVPPRALSLDNMLGLAIGAQGNGGNAAAHFVPGVNEINITRTAGAGSVAHEWAHALDHYFATQAGFGGASEPFLTMWKRRGGKGTIRPEIVKAFAAIVQAMEKRAEAPEETAARAQRLEEIETKRLESWLGWFGKQFAGNDQAAAELSVLADRIRQGDYRRGEDAYVQITPSRGRMNPGTAVLSIVADVRDLAKKYKIAIPIDNIKALNATVSFAKYLEEKQDDGHEPQTVTTQYKSAALHLDKGKKKPYWSTQLEMFARAFDAYIVDRLAVLEQDNSYLAHLNRTGETVPMGAERETINKAFDTLLGELKTKETEQGTALFALNDQATGTDRTEIEKALAPVLKAWKNAPAVQVVQSVTDLPRAVQLQMLMQGIRPQQVQAVFLDGVTLVADNLSSIEEAQQKLLHETVAHYGLRSVLDPETFRKQMLQASLYYANKQNAKWKEIGKTYGLDLKTVEGRIAAAEEMIAHEAETGVDSSVLTRIIAAVREFLRKAGFQMELADAEIREMLARARRFLEGETSGEFGVRNAEGAQFAAAWHGSPHDFERFSTDNIGTGEGAQVYGYGLYFAGNKEVAEFYKQKLANDREVDSWRRKNGEAIESSHDVAAEIAYEMTYEFADEDLSSSQALPVVEKAMWFLRNKKSKGDADKIAANDARLKKAVDLVYGDYEVEYDAPNGRLYHVELAPQEDEYLLWDKPLSEQSEKVKEALKDAFDGIVNKTTDYHKASALDRKFEEYRRYLDGKGNESGGQGNGNWIYEELSYLIHGKNSKTADEKAASDYLHSLGIRGIKYLDGTSRGKGEGNYNYVVFNDADVAITAKFALRDVLPQSALSIPNLPNLPPPADFLQLLNPLDWSRSAAWFDRIAPDQVKAAVGWFARNPVFEGEKDANKQPFVEAGIKREEDKVGFQLRMMKWDGTFGASTFAVRVKDTYGKWSNSDPSTAWGRVQAGYAKLTRAEQTAVNAILVQGDQRFMDYKTLDGALKNPRIAMLKPTPAAFESYRAIRDYIDKDLAQVREDIFRELAREAGLSTAETEKHIADYRNDLAKSPGWMPRNHGEGQHQANVYHVVEALKFETKDLGEEEANRQQAFLPYYAGPQVTGKLAGIVNGINRKYGDIPTGKGSAEARKAYPGLKFGTAIKGEVLLPSGQMVLSGSKEDIAAFLKQSEGVLAAVRTKKEAALEELKAARQLAEDNGASRAELREMDSRIEGARDTRNLVKVYMRLHESRKEADKTIARLGKDLKGEMPANFRAGQKYETSYKVADNLTESIYGDIAGDFAVEQVQMKALKKAVDAGEINADEAREMRRAIIKTSAETLMGRGAGRHQIGRAPYLIEGYDTDSPVQLYHDYMTATAGMLSKAQYAKEQFENYRYAPPEVKQWAEGYIRDSLRNMGLADRVSGNARMLASFWYLGGKMSSILVNGTQVWTLGVAELGRRTKQSAIKAIGQAQMDIMKNRLSPDEQELFNSKVWKLQEMETAVHEVTGAGEGATGKVSQFMHELTNKAMMPFQEMEMLNRRTMILAAYRSAIADGMKRPEAIDFALDVNRKTNFEMSRANLPGWARKPLGRTAYALQSFVWNNWNWIYNRATSGEKADMLALLKYSAMLSLIGGASALAGGDEADKIYRRIFGRSIKLDLQTWTRKHAKEYGTPGELLNAFVWHGGAGVAGVNISNSMRLNIPLARVVTGESTAGEAAMGVFAGLLQKGEQTGMYLQRGMYGKALESAAPEMVASPMKAYRMATDGITTSHGKPVFDENGKPVKYTAAQAATRALGFQPLAQSKRTELQMTKTQLKAHWNGERKDLLDQLRAAGTAEQRRTVTRDIIKFNQGLRASQVKGVVLPIRAETMRSALTHKPDKKEMAWQREQA
jgi:GGDEF domain-containing protein